MNREYPSFVDDLVWSSQPRRLNLQLTREMATVFIDRLMHMKNSIHSTSHGSNPCYSQLKEKRIQIYNLNTRQTWCKNSVQVSFFRLEKEDNYIRNRISIICTGFPIYKLKNFVS